MDSFSSVHYFNKLFNDYYDRFVRFASGYVRERQVAEDFVSEAFTVYWENRKNLSPDSNPPAYILSVVKNRCLNHLQHIQVRQRAEKEINEHTEWLLSIKINSLQACDPDFIFSDEIEKIVASTLESLPQKTRQVFMLNRYQGLSYRDIASQMDLSIKAIEFHISKALSQLRFSLRDFIYLLLFLLYFH
jgi:RNA polymerase sigma-70 factor (ECF subfamily)